jgi:hypothetical protein
VIKINAQGGVGGASDEESCFALKAKAVSTGWGQHANWLHNTHGDEGMQSNH